MKVCWCNDRELVPELWAVPISLPDFPENCFGESVAFCGKCNCPRMTLQYIRNGEGNGDFYIQARAVTPQDLRILSTHGR